MKFFSAANFLGSGRTTPWIHSSCFKFMGWKNWNVEKCRFQIHAAQIFGSMNFMSEIRQEGEAVGNQDGLLVEVAEVGTFIT